MITERSTARFSRMLAPRKDDVCTPEMWRAAERTAFQDRIESICDGGFLDYFAECEISIDILEFI